MKFADLMLGAAVAALAGPSMAAELIVNGGFEANPGITTTYYDIGDYPPGENPIPAGFGWSVPVNDVDIVANGAYGAYLADGGGFNLDLVGFGSTGAISQTFDTELGATYSVSLEYSENSGISGPTAEISVDGTDIGDITGTSSWQTFSTTFTGTGGPTTFELDETYGASNGGVFLDNISVTGPVPEPATWTLALTGFGLLGATLRAGRRRLAAQA